MVDRRAQVLSEPGQPQEGGRHLVTASPEGVWGLANLFRRSARAALCYLLLAAPYVLAQTQPTAAGRDTELLMLVEGVYLSQVADTWGAARSEGRSHEGTDIFAPEGTSVYSATPGYVEWISPYGVGGNTVTVVGAGGVRYYYAHLSRYAEGLENGQLVTTETLLGYVGNTGNAETTPPHLHFGIYTGFWDAENPYPLLVDRAW